MKVDISERLPDLVVAVIEVPMASNKETTGVPSRVGEVKYHLEITKDRIGGAKEIPR